MILPTSSHLVSSRKLLETEYPMRRPQNSFRIINGLADVRNHFIPDRHEQLNESATFILELCDGKHSIIEIWNSLLQEFEVIDSIEALCSVVRMIRYFQRTFILYPSTIKDEQSMDPAIPVESNSSIRF